MSDGKTEWERWARKAAEYIEAYLRSCEGAPEPSENAGKDLMVEFYRIEVEPIAPTERNWRGAELHPPEPGGD